MATEKLLTGESVPPPPLSAIPAHAPDQVIPQLIPYATHLSCSLHRVGVLLTKRGHHMNKVCQIQAILYDVETRLMTCRLCRWQAKWT